MVIVMKKILIPVILLLFPLNVFADGGYSSIVMDMDSGRVLYERNAYSKNLIASTTKIMTAIVTIENSDLNRKLVVGDEILEMYGTNIYLEVGEEMTVMDLLYGLMLRSGNDASVVLSKNVFKDETEFVYKMNEKAKSLGMTNSIFYNPHGLDEETENYSTAYDMAILAKYAFKNKIYRKIISTKKYMTKSNLKSYTWYNRMNLINSYKYCIGGKNGYTPKAGKSLVSYASNGDLNLLIVSLDDSDIYDNHKKLYNICFKKYKNYTIIDKTNFTIDKSFVDKDIYINESFKYPLMEDELEKISTLIQINHSGNSVGSIVIKYNSKDIGRLKIYSKEKKKKDNNIFHKFIKLFV